MSQPQCHGLPLAASVCRSPAETASSYNCCIAISSINFEAKSQNVLFRLDGVPMSAILGSGAPSCRNQSARGSCSYRLAVTNFPSCSVICGGIRWGGEPRWRSWRPFSTRPKRCSKVRPPLFRCYHICSQCIVWGGAVATDSTFSGPEAERTIASHNGLPSAPRPASCRHQKLYLLAIPEGQSCASLSG